MAKGKPGAAKPALLSEHHSCSGARYGVKASLPRIPLGPADKCPAKTGRIDDRKPNTIHSNKHLQSGGVHR